MSYVEMFFEDQAVQILDAAQVVQDPGDLVLDCSYPTSEGTLKWLAKVLYVTAIEEGIVVNKGGRSYFNPRIL